MEEARTLDATPFTANVASLRFDVQPFATQAMTRINHRNCGIQRTLWKND